MNIQERHQYARDKYGLLRNDLYVLHELNRRKAELVVLRKNPRSREIEKVVGENSTLFQICTKATFYRIEHLLTKIYRYFVYDGRFYEDHYRIANLGREVLKDVYGVQLDSRTGNKTKRGCIKVLARSEFGEVLCARWFPKEEK